MEYKLPANVAFIIKQLNNSGKRADIVGGCVRDFLLGKEPYDYDITTSATPDEMIGIFRDFKTIPTGIKHGTLTVIYGGEQFEITTYRKDGLYTDHRRPDSVTFTDDIILDLSRRDFTVNAMAYNDTDGLTDVFGGQEDIRRRLIRAVGDAERRFDEDALRILRALRFSSTLDFDVEEDTARSAKKMAHLIDNVSGERIYSEWKKLVSGVRAYSVIREFPEVIERFVFLDGELRLPTAHSFCSADATTRMLSIFALSCIEPAVAFMKSADRMKIDNKTVRYAVSVLENCRADMTSEIDVRFMLRDIGRECTEGVLRLKAVLGDNTDALCGWLNRIVDLSLPYSISHLAIGGGELHGIGLRGKEIGTTLDALLSAVIRCEVENEQNALVNFAIKLHG